MRSGVDAAVKIHREDSRTRLSIALDRHVQELPSKLSIAVWAIFAVSIAQIALEDRIHSRPGTVATHHLSRSALPVDASLRQDTLSGDEADAAQPVRMVERKGETGHTAERRPHIMGPFDAKRVKQCHDICCQVLDLVGSPGHRGATMAAQIQGEHPVPAGEMVNLSSPTIKCESLRVRQGQDRHTLGPFDTIVVIDTIHGDMRHHSTHP